VAVAVALLILLPLWALDPAPLRILETGSLDLRFRLRGAEPPGNEVAVVLVDDRSLAALGRWPPSRRFFAAAVDNLVRANAKLIVFDLLFAEPDQPIPPELRDIARAAARRLNDPADKSLEAELSRLAGADPDGEFAAAMRTSTRTLLPIAFDFTGPEEELPAFLTDQTYQRFDPSLTTPVFPLQAKSAVTPTLRLTEAAAGFGHVSIPFDRDGSPRYDYLALPIGADFMPSLPIRAAGAYLGLSWDQVGLVLGEGVRLGSTLIPTDAAMRLVVNYRGPRGTIPTYSFVDLVRGQIAADELAGRIVVIGASFIGATDSNPDPFDNTPMPGTERLANIIDTILSHDFIRESPPPWPMIIIAAALALALLTGAAVALLPTRIAALGGAVPLVAWGGGTQLAFLHGLWLPLVSPVIALTAAVATTLLFRYGIVDQQRRRVQAAFRHYLAPELVSALAAHPDQLRLGGETRTLTVMFSDIRGFTSIAEGFKANPEGLSRLINRSFLTPMTNLIMARRGTIDKYMGDCVMAFWNAPLDDVEHADNACATALAMLRELDAINARLKGEAEAENREFQPLRIGVGLNSGECVVGNMGSDARFAYTAMGDAVNLASRLEGQSKTYHISLIIGEATRVLAPRWAALELDLIAVKGKHDAVRIYTLLGDDELAQSPEFRAHADRHERMLACYRARDWAGASSVLADCRCYQTAELAAFYDLYAERIAYFAVNPPGPDWNGVFVAETK
jgi:adenylate cyclase